MLANSGSTNTNAHLSGMQYTLLTPMSVPVNLPVSPIHTQTGLASSSHIHRQRKIFVGGLPSSATESELRQYFGAFGSIDSCIVMMDRQTGRSRGFGFVTFAEDAAVELVIKQERHILLGKIVECKRAVPKEIMEMFHQHAGQQPNAQKRPSRRTHRGSDPLALAGMGMSVPHSVTNSAGHNAAVAAHAQLVRNPFLLSFSGSQSATQSPQNLAPASVSLSSPSSATNVNASAMAAYSASTPPNSTTPTLSQMAHPQSYTSTATTWLPNDQLAAWYRMTAASLADPSAVAAAQAQAQAQAQAANAGSNMNVNVSALQSTLLNAQAAAAATEDIQKRMNALAIASATGAQLSDNSAAKQSSLQTMLGNVNVANHTAAATNAANAANTAALASASYNQALWAAWYQHALQSGVGVDQSQHSPTLASGQSTAPLTLQSINAQATQFATVPAASWISPASSAGLSAANHAHVLAAAAAAAAGHPHGLPLTNHTQMSHSQPQSQVHTHTLAASHSHSHAQTQPQLSGTAVPIPLNVSHSHSHTHTLPLASLTQAVSSPLSLSTPANVEQA